MQTVLNASTTLPCCAGQQKPQVAAKYAGLRSSSIRGSPVACRRPVLARQRLVTPVRAVAAVEEHTKVDQKTIELAINAVRFLSIDGVNKANSGHPGLPMGCAPMGYILYNEIMQHNPKHPKWFNRDRFVLSAGHGCMLQYSLMHLTGYASVSMDDCKQFRQWESKTPGHPENFETEGVEVTTGPLGQGIANAVGIAASEAHLAARFNKEGHNLVDHYTYCIVGDGCNMEGISNEAASLAGHWGLGKLICLYDDNKISIDGHTEISFTEDVNARFDALGWHTQWVKDGNTDLDGIRKAIEEAKKVTDKPSFIKVSTLIGYGSPNKADTHGVHGSPLGADETKLTREALKWPYGEFEIPNEVYDAFGAAGKKGQALEDEWNKTLESYSSKYKEEGEEFKTLINGVLPDGWSDELPTFTTEDKALATRLHSQTMLNALAPVLPGFWGGSADLAPSNMTLMKMYGDFQKGQYQEKNLRYGVREHGMGAIANGIALHNPGMIPYCATFFNFTDYMRASIRMAALSRSGTIFVMTHDSIGLGEDGPTHQPVEHLASFRAMPNILMMRPGDGNETSGAYKVAVENNRGINPKGYGRPSILALSRQGVPNLAGTSKEGVAKGGYIVHGGDGKPDAIVMATGTELGLAVDAAKELEKDGKKIRVVSLVSWELFEEQGKEYKDSILPPDVKARVSVEAASTFGWLRYVGFEGISLGVNQFGQSAPAPTIYEKLGITVDGVVKAVKSLL